MNIEDERDTAEEQENERHYREEQESDYYAERMREEGFRFVSRDMLRGDTDTDWDSLRAILFGHLVPLTEGVVKRYHSDVYHDARWVHENVRGEVTFYYAVREAGTSIGTDRALVSYIGYEQLYRVDVVKSARTYGDVWYVAIGREER